MKKCAKLKLHRKKRKKKRWEKLVLNQQTAIVMNYTISNILGQLIMYNHARVILSNMIKIIIKRLNVIDQTMYFCKTLTIESVRRLNIANSLASLLVEIIQLKAVAIKPIVAKTKSIVKLNVQTLAYPIIAVQTPR